MRTNYQEKSISDISKNSDFTFDNKNKELIFFDSDLSLKVLRIEENNEGQIINWNDHNIKLLHPGLKDCSHLCNQHKNPSNNSTIEKFQSQIQQSNLQNRDSSSEATNYLKNQKNKQEIQQIERNTLNLSCARLIPYCQSQTQSSNSSNKLLFSTSGLTATCMDSTPQTAISTIGFNQGEHFWEFYCPIYCQKIEMGIIAPLINKEHFIDFNTTTPRQATFRLNFHTCKLSVYLNGNLLNQKSQTLQILKQNENDLNTSQSSKAISLKFKQKLKQENNQQVVKVSLKIQFQNFIKIHNQVLYIIFTWNLILPKQQQIIEINNQILLNNDFKLLDQSKVMWYPAIKMKEVGVSVIFNPFAQDPDNPLGIYNFKVNQEDSYKQNSNIDENTKKELQQRIQQLNQMIKDKLETVKKQENEGKVIIQQKQNKDEENMVGNKQLNYQINAIIEQDKIKLIRKNEQGQYPITCSIFQNKPYELEDFIDLIIIVRDASFLLENVDWIGLIEENYLTIKEVHSLFELIKNSVSQQNLLNKYIQLHLNFQLAKKCVDSIGAYSLQQYNVIQKLLSNDKLDNILINQQPFIPNIIFNQQNNLPSVTQLNSINNIQVPLNNIPDEQSGQVFKIKQTYDTIIQQLQIILSLDEQLFAMTLHYEASSKITSMFANNFSRQFSSFSRLGSLLNYTRSQYTPLALSESGVFNSYDTVSNLRHFENPQIKLDCFESMKKKIPLWQNLQLQMPYSRMLSGQTCLNVPLYITVNNIPYQTHIRIREPLNSKSVEEITELDEKQIRILRPHRQYASNYMSTISSDGSVNIWNAEIALFRVLVSDFKRDFIPPKSLKGLLSTNDLKANLKNVESGLFYDLAATSKKNKEFDKKKENSSQSKIISQKDILNQLLKMGYSKDTAQKSINKIKKMNIEDAIQEASRLQIIENQEEEALDSQISLQNIVEEDAQNKSFEQEFEWICNNCTFRNTQSQYQYECETCQTQRKQKPAIQKNKDVETNENKEIKSDSISILNKFGQLDELLSNNKINKNQENQIQIQQQDTQITQPPQLSQVESNISQNEANIFIRPEWICPACEQLVQRSQEVCDKCGTHVPDEFRCNIIEYTALKQVIEKRLKVSNQNYCKDIFQIADTVVSYQLRPTQKKLFL